MEKAVQGLQQQLQPIIKTKQLPIPKWLSIVLGGLLKVVVYIFKYLPQKE